MTIITKAFVVLFFVQLLCCLVHSQSSSFLQSSGSDVHDYQFEGLYATEGECQPCIKYYRDQDKSLEGYFRQAYEAVRELSQNGSECCYEGSSCLYDVGCNHHTIEEIPTVFTNTTNGTIHSVTFQGGLSHSLGQTVSCTPPGDSDDMCAAFQFFNELIENDQDIPIAGNVTLHAAEGSLFTTINISQWTFFSTSIGIRIIFLVMGEELQVTNFDLEPGDITTAFPPVPSAAGTFNGVVMSTPTPRYGGVTFATAAVLDGSNVATPVNITGPYKHEYNEYARYFYVDIPRFNVQVQYSFNTYIPPTTGTPPKGLLADGLSSGAVTTYIIIGCVGGGGLCYLCLCVGGFLFFHRKKNHTKRKSYKFTKKHSGDAD